MRAIQSFWGWWFVYVMGCLTGIAFVFITVATGQLLSADSKEPAPKKVAAVDWRRAYIGANVYIGGKLCTVTNVSVSPYGEYAVITFGDGKHLMVDWAVVTRQVDAACAKQTVEK